jgi:Arc/MetJ-type ribon-helix-helix transcriptional regulator
MESITIKVDPAFARQMDRAMKPLYSTKTEFIRAAIREKIERQKETDELLRALYKTRSKKMTLANDEEDHRIREEVGRQLMREHGIDPDGHKMSSGLRESTKSRTLAK